MRMVWLAFPVWFGPVWIGLAAAASFAAEPVTVRGGDHAGFSRIVFDLDQPVDYEAQLSEGRLTVRLGTELTPDFGTLSADPLERLSAPRATVAEGATLVTLEAPADAELRHSYMGPKLVVDVHTNALAPEDAAMLARAAAHLSQAAAAPPAPAAAPSEPSEAAEPDHAAQTVPRTETQGTPKPSAETIPVTAATDRDGLVLRYAFTRPVPAAAFLRAGYLWVVFEDTREIDHSRLDLRPGTAAGRRLSGAERLPARDAAVLRYKLRQEGFLSMQREGDAWQLHLRDNDTIPRLPLRPVRQATGGTQRIFIPADELGSRLRISDPEVGDQLEIVPLSASGAGLDDDRRYAQLELLASAQGIVIKPLSELVAVQRYTNGVAIAAENGLALSQPGLEWATGQAEAGAPVRLLDLAAWRDVAMLDFPAAEARLLQRLSSAVPTDRSAARWDLARFYLGHGLAAEALAFLTLIAEADPRLAETPEFLAVRGAALVSLARPREGLKDLLAAELDREADVWLWRALAAAQAGRHGDVLDYFPRGGEALPSQDRALQIRLRLAAARAALAEQQLDTAERQIAELQAMALSGRAAAETDYLYGRLAEVRGDLATAEARYEDVAAAEARDLSTRARLARVRLRLGQEAISRAQAVEELEKLRFAWRGDVLELEVLDLLGKLYIEERRHRPGLETYREAIAAFPETPQARRIAAEMSEVFRTLFLDGEADRMAPVAALALFYDFRELTPLGSEGDRMIRHLVERLAAVDLLGRAAELLEHQVNYRLEGPAQAMIAAQLGKIYILDGRPDETLRILRETRQDLLPNDVMTERNRVEAAALTELQRFEEAESLLQDDRSRSADLLRLDIQWAARNWREVVRLGERLLGDRHTREEPLSLDERQQLVRLAVAHSFLDRRDALSELRRRYTTLMKTGELAGVFNLVTTAEQPLDGELDALTGKAGGADRFRSFLAAYRSEFTAGGGAGGSR